MLSGIILTSASIGVMCAAGCGMNMLLSWFNNYEYQPKNKKGGSRGATEHRESGANKERIERLSNSFRP